MNQDPSVVHLHGHWRRPESVVLGSRSYEAILSASFAQAMQQALASMSSMLFVGVGGGLDDPNFTALRRWLSTTMRGSQLRHFQLCTTSEAKRIEETRGTDEALHLIEYGDEHEDLAGWLERLATDARRVSSFDEGGSNEFAGQRVPATEPGGGTTGALNVSARAQEGMWVNSLQVRYPKFGGRTATQIWPSDPSWPERYTKYALALDLTARVSAAEQQGEMVDADRLFDELGDGSMAVWSGLDTFKRSRRGNGEFLAREVLLPAIERLYEAAAPMAPVDEGARAIVAWKLWCTGSTGHAWSGRFRELMPALDDAAAQAAQSARWARGLSELDMPAPGSELPSLTLEAAPWLYRLTVAIDDALTGERDQDAVFDAERPFRGLMPEDLEAEYVRRAGWLRDYRQQLVDRGIGALGISITGLTDIYARALPQIRERLGRGLSMLVVGPTSTGKTDIGRTAAAYIVSRKRKVIVLLPTKALVSQAAEEWAEFFALADSSREWRIVEASRDYPFNDERVAKGDFDILLAIPEKLASYVSSGSRVMRQCGLIIVDEFQYLAQKQRGPNIESLLTVLRSGYPDVPMLALSAPITSDSVANISRWLGILPEEGEGVIATNIRPVPLARHAFDGARWKLRDGVGELTQGRWLLRDPAQEWRQTLNPSSARYEDVISLTLRMLTGEEDGQSTDLDQSILIFVNGRASAERLSRAIQDALEVADSKRAGRRPMQWRYALGMTESEATVWEDRVRSLPDLPATNDVRRGLRSGVAYHTARLDPEHRRLIETAYKNRIVRVIVATATLAIGVNLPADVVIVADIAEAAGGLRPTDNKPRQRLLTVHEVGQRLGRCGRLGKSSGGVAFVMALAPGDASQVELDAEQMRDLIAAGGINVREHADPEAFARSRLSDVDVVFDALVDREIVGETVRSGMTAKSFARLLLQDMSRIGVPMTPEALHDRAARMYDRSLLKAEGASAHGTPEMLDILLKAGLVGLAPGREDGALRPSGVGRTVGFSNLPLENAEAIARLALAAQQGAGPFTLLTMAAEAPYVNELNWIGLPMHNQFLLDLVRQNIWTVVRCFIEPGLAESTGRDIPDRSFLALLNRSDIVGTGPIAQALRGRGADPTVNMSDLRLIAHFRACVAMLWQRGLPMQSILSFVTRNTEAMSTRPGGKRPERAQVSAYSADVRDLGERLSYIINAASEVLRVQPAGGRHLLLKNLAESLQSGVPYQLAPLMWIRSPRIHRERLSRLFSMRSEELDFDDLPGVLDTLSKAPADADASQRVVHQSQAFTAAERDEIVRELARSRGTFKGANALPPEVRNEPLPWTTEGYVEYADLAASLAKPGLPMARRLEDLQLALESFGLDLQPLDVEGYPGFTVSRAALGETFELVVVPEQLRRAGAKRLAAPRRLLLAFDGLSAGAEYDLRATTVEGYAALSPWVLLAGLAFIDLDWRKFEGADPQAELARRVLTFFSRATGPITLADLSVADVTSSLAAPPPFV